MAFQVLLRDYKEIPFVTRLYTTACVLTSLAVVRVIAVIEKFSISISIVQQLDLVDMVDLYYDPKLVFRYGQIWRLVTCFCYFGQFGFSFLFSVIFTYRYCRMLEENSFRGRTADFFAMFLYGGILMIILASAVSMAFLGQAFTIMLVYVWSRRNPFVRLTFFGVLSFSAPYLPWILFAFSLLLGNSFMVDVLGIICGHFYYFLEDVFPREPGGFKVLVTPAILKRLLDSPDEHVEYQPMPGVGQPGGFNWFENDAEPR